MEEVVKAGDADPKDLMLLYVVGEETTGDGMKTFSAGWTGKPLEAAIFGEPTEKKLACGHKGHAGCRVIAKGKAGHSGYPWLGKSATEVLMRGLVKVLDADLGGSERFGNTTVNVGVISGGAAANVIAENATASLAIRIAAGTLETGYDIMKSRLEKILDDTDSDALTLDCVEGYGPIECDCDVEGKASLPWIFL
jgi:acetylornithine deacetylase/succinyl-diaminopimelate desuccinylase-like protein